ncbi:LuxR family transcriptional regulator [Aureimonas endophytica]|uniref:LuxR family transcriptional regulator n=1 Tax=Aureimonas endophytica TaxID=2027858 RepID=A0A917E316_9HYPH|nr:helix-turn-helix transcriptional regulator [Aureimonas endophytica]GGD96653.1 LuxR family transcriptional regulator [Aureimonas endophytica]
MASIDDLIDGFYDAAESQERLVEALTAAHRHFRAPAGGLFVQNLRQEAGRMQGAEAAIALGYDPVYGQAYWDRYYTLNPMFHVTKQMGAGVVTRDTDTLRLPSRLVFQETEFYRDWAKPQHLDHVMGEFVERRGDGVLIMALWRSRSEGGFAADEAVAFARLNRHIARAIDIGARLRSAEAEMETLLGRMPAAVVTLGRDGHVRQANARAEALFALGIALRWEAGRLRTAMPQDQAALDRLLACALDPRFSAWAEHAAVPIHRADGRPPLTARTIAVAHRFDPFAPDRAASVILTIEGFEAETEAVEARLRRRFGLSAAQGRVAMQLREGRSPAEAAQALGLSVETVRSHLRVLFQRTGTRRQTELVLCLRGEGDRP